MAISVSPSNPLISEFPTEILQHIYTFLPTIQTIKCREVCAWWKQTVDGMLSNDEVWLKLCALDFSKVYKDARLKSAPDLSWWELYKSLHIWHKLKHSDSEETWFEFAQRDVDHITTIHAWKGTAATHTEQTIVYYSLEKLQPVNILNIGKFKMFEENEHVMVYMIYTNSHMLWYRNLQIVPKLKGLPSYENVVEIENVNNFLLVDKKIYFNKWQRRPESILIEIYVCNIINDNVECSLMNSINSGVWAFGYNKEKLNFITVDDTIYTEMDNEFILSDRVTDENCFYKLSKHNLLERANFYGWIMDAKSITSRSNYLRDLTIRLWGDLVLIGNEKGHLKIYDRQLLYNDIQAKPIRNYDLQSIFNLTNTEINGIDLVPVKDGHIVLVSTPCKIIALSLMIRVKNR